MYRLTDINTGDVIGLTAEVNYIRRNPTSGCLIGASREEATGVAYKSEPYNLSGTDGVEAEITVCVSEFDAGDIGLSLQETTIAQKKDRSDIDYIAMEMEVDLDE